MWKRWLQKGQNPRERIKNGRILRSASSHVREEVFFCPEKNKKNEEVGGGSQGEVVMESAPRSSLKVIEAEVILVALEVLFDLEALTAQAQQRDAFRRSIQPGGVNMVRFGLALRPVEDQPGFGNLTGVLSKIGDHPCADPSHSG